MSLPRARRRGRVSACGIGLIVVGSLVVDACSAPPTEVVLTVFSDVACDAQVAVAVGKAGELGDRPASATSNVCDPATGSRGVLVMVPKQNDNDEIASPC